MILKEEVQIANITVVFTLSSKLSRDEILKRFQFVKYPKNFSGGILNYPEGVLIIFDSGKINVTGVRNVMTAFSLIERFCLTYGHDIKSIHSRIANMVAFSRLKDDFNYNNLQNHPGYSYEAELFPGIHFKPDNSKVTFIIFRSTGRITITGITNQNDIHQYFDMLETQTKSI